MPSNTVQGRIAETNSSWIKIYRVDNFNVGFYICTGEMSDELEYFEDFGELELSLKYRKFKSSVL